ncbi:MAG: hypothetical protein HKO93_02660, partial [Flavobacteriales bacterium]|nr:hypothetical protein [Flavobacteriales bacterium]
MKYFILFFSFLFSANIYAQDCTIVDFTMETGVWADEISWNVTDEFGNVVYESSIDYVNYTITTETT